ncbi:hypothetical protein MMC07_007246 [Pseudocyphellaria aurata]|nr:hypothetical protein [Pseudocyphellaria aurata]
MPIEENFSDDYVANLLARDARNLTARYSTSGLQAFLPKRPTTNAPKPNTRFLKTIIKETDSHNAALRVKDAQDAKARFRQLQSDRVGISKRRKSRGEEGYYSKRRRLDIRPDENLGPRKQRGAFLSQSKVADDQKDRRRSRRHHHDDYTRDEEYNEHSRRRQHSHHHRSDRRLRRDRSKERKELASQGGSSRHNDRSRSPTNDREYNRRRKHKVARSVSSASSIDTASHERADPKLSRTKTSPRHGGGRVKPDELSASQKSDSDPLESIIGPRPPPSPLRIRARGRGTFASSSAIDSHFSSKYDPSEDVHPNSDSENDWDQALEALRDRQRWKQQGADRLRSAGFTEEEVGKWEKGGEKREEDVRWKGRGEGREWDRGKVLEDERVETRPEWGRLKGT